MVFGPFSRAVFVVMKIANGEEIHPGARIWGAAMDEHEGRDQLLFSGARDNVHHSRSVLDGEEPKIVRHLLIGEIRAGHVNHCLPMTFDKAI